MSSFGFAFAVVGALLFTEFSSAFLTQPRCASQNHVAWGCEQQRCVLPQAEALKS